MTIKMSLTMAGALDKVAAAIRSGGRQFSAVTLDSHSDTMRALETAGYIMSTERGRDRWTMYVLTDKGRDFIGAKLPPKDDHHCPACGGSGHINDARRVAGDIIDPFGWKFARGDRVTKIGGSQWSGTVVGFYSTSLTPRGYNVESEFHANSVQLYPEGALERLS